VQTLDAVTFRFSDPGPSGGSLNVTAWIYGTPSSGSCLFTGQAIRTSNQS
jgi:hypothetical protein